MLMEGNVLHFVLFCFELCKDCFNFLLDTVTGHCAFIKPGSVCSLSKILKADS